MDAPQYWPMREKAQKWLWLGVVPQYEMPLLMRLSSLAERRWPSGGRFARRGCPPPARQSNPHYGRLDIAFNNAGILGNFEPIHQQTSADFDSVIAINLRGVWLSIKYEVETFLAQNSGGVIVNTSSWLAKGALAGSSSYSASKGALDALIRAVALNMAITLSGLTTSIPASSTHRWPIATSDPSAFIPFISHTPAQRLGQPEDIADVAVWLSTDDARFITGQNILVDGGYTIAGMR